jgi:hypothetical protein
MEILSILTAFFSLLGLLDRNVMGSFDLTVFHLFKQLSLNFIVFVIGFGDGLGFGNYFFLVG